MPQPILQIVGTVLGTALLWSAFGLPQFRDVEGFLEGSACVPIALGLAVLVISAFAGGRLALSARWFGLSLFGQAAALQLFSAGPGVRYQHIVVLSSWSTTHVLALACVLAQLATVAVVGRRVWGAYLSQLRQTVGTWQLVMVGVAMAFLSAVPSQGLGVYVSELMLVLTVQLVNLATVVLAVNVLPTSTLGAVVCRVFGPPGETCPGPRIGRFALGVAAWVVVVSATFTVWPYERHPHIPDEVAYLRHASYLAEGQLTMSAPPVRDGFDVDLLQLETNRWYSPVPPGWPTLLSVSARFGQEWLVNPLFAGVSIVLAFLVLGELYGVRLARLSIGLLAVSPWYLFMGMNVMTHMSTLAFALAATLGIIAARRLGRAMWGLWAGACVGVVSLIRPLDGLIVAVLLGMWSVGVGVAP